MLASGWAERNPIVADKAKKYRQAAAFVKQAPWCMTNAARYLEDWVGGGAAAISQRAPSPTVGRIQKSRKLCSGI
jgi:hypothetical protein